MATKPPTSSRFKARTTRNRPARVTPHAIETLLATTCRRLAGGSAQTVARPANRGAHRLLVSFGHRRRCSGGIAAAMTGTKAQVSGSAGGDDGDVSSGSSSLASMLAPMTGGVVIGAAIGVGQPGATCVHQEADRKSTRLNS